MHRALGAIILVQSLILVFRMIYPTAFWISLLVFCTLLQIRHAQNWAHLLCHKSNLFFLVNSLPWWITLSSTLSFPLERRQSVICDYALFFFSQNIIEEQVVYILKVFPLHSSYSSLQGFLVSYQDYCNNLLAGTLPPSSLGGLQSIFYELLEELSKIQIWSSL